jgi:hypothetical protein
MPKTWKELAEELKSLAEVLLEQAKQAFREGDIERGLMLTKEFRSAIKTAGDLNMIAQGAGELEDFEEEDIEKALGLEDEDDLEEEEGEDEIEEDEENEEDYDEYADDDEEFEEEADNDEDELETDYDFAEEERQKIKNQVGDSIISLEQILRGIARKKT